MSSRLVVDIKMHVVEAYVSGCFVREMEIYFASGSALFWAITPQKWRSSGKNKNGTRRRITDQ